jgi:hypothetical protein
MERGFVAEERKRPPKQEAEQDPAEILRQRQKRQFN